MTRAVLAVLLAALMMTGCFDPKSTVSDADVMVIDPKDLAALLEQSKNRPFLVDVRSPAEFARGRIAGALNIPLNDLREGDRRLRGAKAIVVYAEGFSDARSGAAAKKLLRMGYKNVSDMRGGLTHWQDVQGDAAIEAD